MNKKVFGLLITSAIVLLLASTPHKSFSVHPGGKYSGHEDPIDQPEKYESMKKVTAETNELTKLMQKINKRLEQIEKRLKKLEKK